MHGIDAAINALELLIESYETKLAALKESHRLILSEVRDCATNLSPEAQNSFTEESESTLPPNGRISEPSHIPNEVQPRPTRSHKQRPQYPSTKGNRVPRNHQPMEERRKAIANYIRLNGPKSAIHICRELGIPNGSSTAIFTCEYFEQEQDGWHLTAEGRTWINLTNPALND